MDTSNYSELDNNNLDCSILALSEPTSKLISDLLNPIKLIPTEDHKLRDYRGFAELCGISGELIRSITNDSDPTSKVLKMWLDHSKSGATVANLVNYLEQLDRFDVVDDVSILISEDVKLYQNRSNGKIVNDIDYHVDSEMITTDDLQNFNEGLEPQRYDAFVLFDDDDIDFATKLIDNLEERNLKLCVKERDVLPGKFEIDAVIKLITERCKKVIVIISTAFLRSCSNTFFFKMANSISMDQRYRKIIPCIYKECEEIPADLNCYVKLDIRRSGMWNFWDQLCGAIVNSDRPRPKLSLPENSLFNRLLDSRESITRSNAVTRSVSNSDQYLSPADIRRTSSSSSRNVSSPSVKFSSNSMNDLPNTEVPEDNIVPSTSANSLGQYKDNAIHNALSFFKKLRLMPKKSSKSKSLSANDDAQISSSLEPEENGIENAADQVDDQNAATEIKNNIQIIKEEKKAKKKKFLSFKLHKKKELVAAT